MFDIGLGEFLLVGAIAVLLISPKQLPLIAKTLAVTFARVQGFITSIKQEINQQSDALGLAELKREMHNTQILAQEALDRMLQDKPHHDRTAHHDSTAHQDQPDPHDASSIKKPED
jgi:Sec-independent protein translocase protein TatA